MGGAVGRSEATGRGWVVVVPVKRPEAAKSRLRGAAPGVPHADLVTALVRDTLAAVRRCPAVAEVIVVGGPRPGLAGVPGVALVDEPRHGGLNAAVQAGAARVAGAGVAALLGDLPALDPRELGEALALAGTRAFVADTAGTGTTLLAAPAGTPLDPHFGPGSAAAHRASGARPLDGAWPTLRRDVDTADDLAQAAALGLGAHTAALLAGARRSDVH